MLFIFLSFCVLESVLCYMFVVVVLEEIRQPLTGRWLRHPPIPPFRVVPVGTCMIRMSI